MKIVGYETFLVAPRWLFLRIDTDEGVVGWGEPIVEGRAEAVQGAVDALWSTSSAATRCGSRTTGRCWPRAASTAAVRCCRARWPGSTRRCGTSRASYTARPCTSCSAARCATASASTLGHGGDTAAARRRRAGQGGQGIHRGQDEPRRGAAGHSDGRRDRRHGRAGSRPLREALGDGRRHRRRLPRPVQYGGRPADPAAAGAATCRSSSRSRCCRSSPATCAGSPSRPASRSPPASGSTPAGTSARAARRHRGRPAGPVPRGRNLRGAPDRRDGRGVRRGGRAALPAGPDRAGREPAGRLGHPELPDPGAEPRHPLRRRQRAARLPGRPDGLRVRRRPHRAADRPRPRHRGRRGRRTRGRRRRPHLAHAGAAPRQTESFAEW